MERYTRHLKVLIALLLLCNNVYASPPTRQSTYTPGETILSSAVTANENVIYNYLQAGVDTLADGSVVNADLASNANIQSDKINLTSIAQNILNTGTLTNTGNVTITGTLSVSSTATITGGIVNTAIGATTPSTGAFTTLKVGTTHQGDVLYDNGTSIIRLVPGTSGQLLKTNGASANPAWTSTFTGSLVGSVNLNSGSITNGSLGTTSSSSHSMSNGETYTVPAGCYMNGVKRGGAGEIDQVLYACP